MTDRPSRPRATLGAALALVAATAAMPGAVAFPLAVLLAGARPATRWLVVSVALAFAVMAGWMAYSGVEDPLTLLTHISTIVGAALFVLLMRSGARPALESSLLATGAALAVGIVGISALGLDLASTRADLVYSSLPSDPEAVAAFRESELPISAMMALFDATFALALIAGQCVAWRWYRILATPADLPPSAPFAEFRFSDHLVWLFILGLLGVVAQVAGQLPEGAAWPAALLAVMTVLYVVRGLAVFWPRSSRLSPPLLLLLGVAVLFLVRFAPTLPRLALPGLLGLGLADTWLDFRRRAAEAADAPGD